MVLIADTLEDFYQNYFEGLATEYCGHEAGFGKPHFYVNNFIESMSEVNDALRSKLSPEGVSMILDMFDDDIDMNDALPCVISGAFAIIQKFDSKNPASLRGTRKHCRAVARRILMRMKRDTYESIDEDAVLAANFVELIGSSQGQRLGVVGDTFTGWGYTFNWRLPEHLFFGA